MAKIEGSLPYVLENEGGWTIDDGGWTMDGLVVDDVAAYLGVDPSQITEAQMKDLEPAEVAAIYKQIYWDKMNLDSIKEQAIATTIFDTGVNMGVHVGGIFAQQVANAMGGGLSLDGAIGPLSAKAINECDKHTFIAMYEKFVMARYEALVRENPAKYQQYFAGWSARAKRLLTLI